MTHEHLRALAELQSAERAFMSVYLTGAESLSWLHHRFRKVRTLLLPDEQAHFDENERLAREVLDTHRFDGAGLCAFVCWANDFVEVHPLSAISRDLLWVDSSPYIRPVAELLDEYETFAVVKADNSAAEVYVVTSERAAPDAEARVRGDVKNRVKKGGWSQKRYARRREKELHEYAKGVGEALVEAAAATPFSRIVLVGQKEALEEIRAVLPTSLADKVVGQGQVDVDDDAQVWQEVHALFDAEERADERALWERIREAALRGGAGVVGPEDVLREAAVGRVSHLLVARDAKVAGARCMVRGYASRHELSTACPRFCGNA